MAAIPASYLYIYLSQKKPKTLVDQTASAKACDGCSPRAAYSDRGWPPDFGISPFQQHPWEPNYAALLAACSKTAPCTPEPQIVSPVDFRPESPIDSRQSEIPHVSSPQVFGWRVASEGSSSRETNALASPSRLNRMYPGGLHRGTRDQSPTGERA